MHRLQEAVRLHRMGCSRRVVARRLGMGRDTLRALLDACAAAGVLDGAPETLPDAETLRDVVAAVLPESTPPQQASSVERWRTRIVALRARGAQPTAIHDRLRLEEPEFDGSLSAVKRLCRALDRAEGPRPADVVIRVETAPGEVAQVDFGYAGLRYDPDRGILRKSWVFVMTLGFSRHMYADLVFDQRLDTWLRLHVDAFEFLGGVPHVIVPDNLKCAVVRAAFAVDDDPAINRSYRELARHCGFQIDPAPPRAPEKKGKVEAGVRYVKRNFVAAWESVDLPEDRRRLRRWLTEIAGRRRHGTTGRPPLELFLERERDALRPLPPQRWERTVWHRAVLHRDCHVQVDGAFYSAPWHLVGQVLWVRATPHRIAIHRGDEPIWTHPRVRRGERSTVDHHLPEHRRDLRHRSREHWVARAATIGPDVAHLVESIFGADDVLLRLRRVQAIVSHLEGFPPERACAAAARALHFGSTEYAAVKGILRQGLDLVPLPGSPGSPDSTTRTWSRGSRFARRPDSVLPIIQETMHVHH